MNKSMRIDKFFSELKICSRKECGEKLKRGLITVNGEIVKKGEIKMIPTGIAISLPSNEYVAYIYARSGLACKKGICLANSVGVVDSDYRGEIKCGLINLGSEDFTVNHGDRIAQLVIAPVAIADIEECETLDDTERGAGGFGSTGV